jgi:hypothetical protein
VGKTFGLAPESSVNEIVVPFFDKHLIIVDRAASSNSDSVLGSHPGIPWSVDLKKFSNHRFSVLAVRHSQISLTQKKFATAFEGSMKSASKNATNLRIDWADDRQKQEREL